MATQDADGIPFSLSHEQQGFRLLELPSELLDLLAGPQPPVLSIKSSEVSDPAAPAHAVLCTPTKTYHLRHVQTSNSVFLTQPFDHASDDAEAPPVPGISAIASCTATLELHPSTDSALPYLKQVLPVWHLSVEEPPTPPASQARSKHAIFEHIPLSPGECDAAWIQLCAFVDSGASFRPSARARLRIWQALVAGAYAESIDLGSQFLVADLWGAVADEGFPQGLLEAVLRRLAPEEQDVAGGWAAVDVAKCVAWVGATVLEAQAEKGREVLTAQFLDVWRDCLPEAWRGQAELSAIEGVYVLSGATNIVLKPELASETGAGQAEASNKPATGARKWHEKFKKGRR